jgi:hypothetical protein
VVTEEVFFTEEVFLFWDGGEGKMKKNTYPQEFSLREKNFECTIQSFFSPNLPGPEGPRCFTQAVRAFFYFPIEYLSTGVLKSFHHRVVLRHGEKNEPWDFCLRTGGFGGEFKKTAHHFFARLMGPFHDGGVVMDFGW